MSRWRTVLAVLLLAWIARPPSAGAFETNGKHWAEMPVPYWINPRGCPQLDSGEDIEAILQLATANWCAPACSAVSFAYQGETDATWLNDGQNTIFCVDQDWNFGQGAAGATLWIPTDPGQPLEVDLALNAADFQWVLGGGDALQTDVLDPVAMITHELGHWLGLSHTPAPFATMYFAQLPNGMGATLAGDDVAGICSLYPSGTEVCQQAGDCPDGWTCTGIQGVSVCDEIHDPPGAFCSKDYIDCDGMCWVSFFECSQVCLFTSVDYSDGYCAPLCEDGPCPDGFSCQYLQQYDVHVCFLDGEPPDGGDGDQVDADGDGGLVDDGSAADGDRIEDGGDEVADGAVLEDGDSPPGDPQPDAGADPGPGDRDEAGGGCGCGTSPTGSWPAASFLFGLLVWGIARQRRR